VIEVHLDLDGYPVTVVDTAGIREAAEPVEQEGVRRARARAAAADLVLWVTDVSVEGRASARLPGLKSDAPQWLVKNKIDLLKAIASRGSHSGGHPERDEFKFVFSISAQRGEGLDALFGALAEFARKSFPVAEAAVVTRARHRGALEDTAAALDRAVAESAAKTPREEVIAEELRHAAWALGRLTGRVDVEDVLDKIFRDFCIGK
jgi:tRNA modification GTPase